MRTSIHLALVLLSLLALSGCRSYLKPLDNSPLPVLAPVKANGGGLIVRDAQGRLILRPDPTSFEASWGVGLVELDGVVRVAARLSPTSHLEEGDVLKRVSSSRIRRRRRVPVVKGASDVKRATEDGHQVTSLEDLRGYGQAWVMLSLLIDRGGEELVVRQEVGKPQVLPLTTWERQHTSARGVELTRIDAWPEDWRPEGSDATDLLVVHVGVESLLGLQGLRPLDVIQTDGEGSARPTDYMNGYTFRDLTRREDELILRGKRDIQIPEWETARDGEFPFVPGLVSLHSDGVRSHVGFGPMDLLFHYNDKMTYNARTDAYTTVARWSLLTTIQVQTVGGDEQSDLVRVDVNPFGDAVRLNYYMERITGDEDWDD